MDFKRLGCYDYHEALDRTNLVREMIAENLCNLPAIVNSPHWYDKAIAAETLISELYQEIGAFHVGRDPADYFSEKNQTEGS